MFEAPDGRRAYIAQPTIDGSRRVRSGFLDVSEGGTLRLSSAFWEAWELSSLFETETREVSAHPGPVATVRSAPGLSMETRDLAKPVVSCDEAAAARGIPLENELKTLLLKTQNGFVAAHLPGNGMLSLRKIKNRLELAEAYLADPEDLLAMGLSAGTVSAVLDPVWSMPHLVSRRLLDMREVMTNNGTRTGYFAFDPAILVEAKDVIVADIEK